MAKTTACAGVCRQGGMWKVPTHHHTTVAYIIPNFRRHRARCTRAALHGGYRFQTVRASPPRTTHHGDTSRPAVLASRCACCGCSSSGSLARFPQLFYTPVPSGPRPPIPGAAMPRLLLALIPFSRYHVVMEGDVVPVLQDVGLWASYMFLLTLDSTTLHHPTPPYATYTMFFLLHRPPATCPRHHHTTLYHTTMPICARWLAGALPA